MNPDYERIKTTDPIVRKVLADGGTLEDVIVTLVRHAEEARALFKDMEIQSTKLMKRPSVLPDVHLLGFNSRPPS